MYNPFRRHRCCYLCKEEMRQSRENAESLFQSVNRPSGARELLTSLKRNTEAREELTRQMRKTEEAIKQITQHGTPTHIQTSAGIRMNLPDPLTELDVRQIPQGTGR